MPVLERCLYWLDFFLRDVCNRTVILIVKMLECLWKLKWSSIDGLGALVISPTRELVC